MKKIKSLFVSSFCLSMLALGAVSVSAEQSARVLPEVLTEKTHPVNEPTSSVVIGRAVKATDTAKSFSALAVNEIKIYGENPFYGISGAGDGLKTGEFNSTTYSNIQVNSWAEATNMTDGDYTIELKRKPNWYTSPVSYGSMTYPFGQGVGTYVGTWTNVGPNDNFYCIIDHNAGSTLKLNGGITVYEKQ